MALERQKIQINIVQTENKVGVSLVKPSVDFKKPLDDIPEIIAPAKNK
tara:strand:- start:329 stop:472 length:144 start_codon:yes stop_codon:yes gene_type:complete